MDCQLVVLAAGNGTRIQSADLPKVMHTIDGTPMLEMVLSNACDVTRDVVLVHSSKLRQYLDPYKNICQFVIQDIPLGTAHAVYSALDLIDDTKVMAVLYGDSPFISAQVIKALLHHLLATESAVTTLSFEHHNPAQYGRIITDQDNNFLKIVEFKDASEAEAKVTLCNSGVTAFNKGMLRKYLPRCIQQMKAGKEVYLTEMIKICRDAGEKVSYFTSQDHNCVVGINTQKELQEANMVK